MMFAVKRLGRRPNPATASIGIEPRRRPLINLQVPAHAGEQQQVISSPCLRSAN